MSSFCNFIPHLVLDGQALTTFVPQVVTAEASLLSSLKLCVHSQPCGRGSYKRTRNTVGSQDSLLTPAPQMLLLLLPREELENCQKNNLHWKASPRVMLTAKVASLGPEPCNVNKVLPRSVDKPGRTQKPGSPQQHYRNLESVRLTT